MAERTAEDSLKLHQVLVLQMLRDRVPPAELLSMSCPTSSQKMSKSHGVRFIYHPIIQHQTIIFCWLDMAQLVNFF